MKFLTKRVTLVPQQYSERCIEKILMLDDELDPVCLFHIDLLWDSQNYEIYEKLDDGMTVECEMTLKEIE